MLRDDKPVCSQNFSITAPVMELVHFGVLEGTIDAQFKRNEKMTIKFCPFSSIVK